MTGGTGLLGRELVKLRGYAAPSRAELDVTCADEVRSVLWDVAPDVVVHAAAYTDTRSPDVDGAEAAACWRTNVLGTRHVVDAADCPIILISSESCAHPYNFYCCTKLQAEIEATRARGGFTVVRTGFRPDPFPFPVACVDMWTLGDTPRVIAGLVDGLVGVPPADGVVYVGTGVKSVYDLAVRTRPDVHPVLRSEVSLRLPAMIELLHV